MQGSKCIRVCLGIMCPRLRTMWRCCPTSWSTHWIPDKCSGTSTEFSQQKAKYALAVPVARVGYARFLGDLGSTGTSLFTFSTFHPTLSGLCSQIPVIRVLKFVRSHLPCGLLSLSLHTALQKKQERPGS